MGINPIASLLEPTGLLNVLPPENIATLTGNQFFPTLISSPFQSGLALVFGIAAAMMFIAAVASWFASSPIANVSQVESGDRLGEEPKDYVRVENPDAELT